MEIKKAEALAFVCTNCSSWLTDIKSTVSAAASVASKASNSISAAGINSLSIKEWKADAVAFALINIVLKEMIRSVTQWVKSGFKGSPAFVTDLQGFLVDIADKVAGNIIWGSDLKGICAPFNLNIRLALDIQYKATKGLIAQCRLSSVIKNVDKFLAGDFLQGGWDGWYSVALVPSNNPYEIMLDAQNKLNLSMGGALYIAGKKLDFGRGFLGVEQCPEDGDFGACKTVTPGVVVEQQLNLALGSPMRRVEVADEVNELVGALFAQLTSQVLGGVGGLLGLNEKQGSGGSYFDRLSAEAQSSIKFDNGSTQPIKKALLSETTYQSQQREIIAMIREARNYKEKQYPDIEIKDTEGNVTRVLHCATGALPYSLQNQLDTASSSIISSAQLSVKIEGYDRDMSALESSSTTQTTLDAIMQQYSSVSVPEAQSKILDAFINYENSGVLHGEESTATLELITIPDLTREIDTFKSSIDTACKDYNKRTNDNGSSE